MYVVIAGMACTTMACGSSGNRSGGAGSGGGPANGGSAQGGSTAAAGASGSVGAGGQAGQGGSTSGGGLPAASGGLPAVGGGLPAAGGSPDTGGTAGTGRGGMTGGGGFSASGGSAGANSDASPSDGAGRDGSSIDSGRGGSAAGGTTATGGTIGTGGSTTGRDAGTTPAKITVWLAGDSTVMNCTDACPCGWGEELQPLLDSRATVVNSAVGGRSIQTWLYDPNVTTTMDATGECVVSPKTYSTRWQAMIDPANGMKLGDYLFIQFGINDSDTTCNRHVGTALFQSYLGVMIQAAKALGANPILVTPTSYIGCSGSTASSNRGFGPQVKAAAAAASVPVIDLTALSAQLYTSLGLCPNDANYTSTTSALGKFFCDDHTHFEAAGAVQIAGLVAKALKDQGIGLAAFLK